MRRILLIDSDTDFAERLSRLLSPYQVAITTNADGIDALSRLDDVAPTALIISVEEPDKFGYALCNKAKKGAGASLPVVLVTTTIDAEGFANHRRLKIHADEYIDKRSVSDEELLGKIDNLIQLGEAPAEEESYEEVPVEVDDVEMEEMGELRIPDDFLDPSAVAAPSVRTSPPPADGGLESETDAAFDALMGDDLSDASSIPVEVETEEPLPAAESRPPEESRARAPVMLVEPPSIHAESMRLHDAGGFDSERPRPRTKPPSAPPGAPDRHHPRTKPPSVPPAAPLAAVDLPLPAPTIAPIPSPVPEPGFDVGLVEVAARADAEQSGLHERRNLQRLSVLERENAQLKGELERARQEPANRAGGREREFVNLRELLSTRDRELLESREEVAERDRQITDLRERLRQAQHAKSALENKNVELEQRLVGESDQAESALAKQQAAETAVINLEGRLAERDRAVHRGEELLRAAEARLLAATDETRQAHALAESERAQHAEELRRLHAELDDARAQGAALMQHAVETMRSELSRQHQADIARLTEDHAAALAEGEQRARQDVAALSEQHKLALAASDQQSERALATADEQHQRALSSQQDAHESALAALQRSHQQEMQALIRQQQDAISELSASLRSEHALALEEAGQQHRAERSRLQELHAAAVASAAERDEEHQRAIAAANAAHAAELAAVRATSDAHERALAAANAQVNELGAQVAKRQKEMAGIESTIAAARTAVEERDQRLRDLRQQLEELERENTGYQEQVLKAYQKLKSDEAMVARAKKAMAIALTALDADNGARPKSD